MSWWWSPSTETFWYFRPFGAREARGKLVFRELRTERYLKQLYAGFPAENCRMSENLSAAQRLRAAQPTTVLTAVSDLSVNSLFETGITAGNLILLLEQTKRRQNQAQTAYGQKLSDNWEWVGIRLSKAALVNLQKFLRPRHEVEISHFERDWDRDATLFKIGNKYVASTEQGFEHVPDVAVPPHNDDGWTGGALKLVDTTTRRMAAKGLHRVQLHYSKKEAVNALNATGLIDDCQIDRTNAGSAIGFNLFVSYGSPYQKESLLRWLRGTDAPQPSTIIEGKNYLDVILSYDGDMAALREWSTRFYRDQVKQIWFPHRMDVQPHKVGSMDTWVAFQPFADSAKIQADRRLTMFPTTLHDAVVERCGVMDMVGKSHYVDMVLPDRRQRKMAFDLVKELTTAYNAPDKIEPHQQYIRVWFTEGGHDGLSILPGTAQQRALSFVQALRTSRHRIRCGSSALHGEGDCDDCGKKGAKHSKEPCFCPGSRIKNHCVKCGEHHANYLCVRHLDFTPWQELLESYTRKVDAFRGALEQGANTAMDEEASTDDDNVEEEGENNDADEDSEFEKPKGTGSPARSVASVAVEIPTENAYGILEDSDEEEEDGVEDDAGATAGNDATTKTQPNVGDEATLKTPERKKAKGKKGKKKKSGKKNKAGKQSKKGKEAVSAETIYGLSSEADSEGEVEVAASQKASARGPKPPAENVNGTVAGCGFAAEASSTDGGNGKSTGGQPQARTPSNSAGPEQDRTQQAPSQPSKPQRSGGGPEEQSAEDRSPPVKQARTGRDTKRGHRSHEQSGEAKPTPPSDGHAKILAQLKATPIQTKKSKAKTDGQPKQPKKQQQPGTLRRKRRGSKKKVPPGQPLVTRFFSQGSQDESLPGEDSEKEMKSDAGGIIADDEADGSGVDNEDSEHDVKEDQPSEGEGLGQHGLRQRGGAGRPSRV